MSWLSAVKQKIRPLVTRSDRQRFNRKYHQYTQRQTPANGPHMHRHNSTPIYSQEQSRRVATDVCLCRPMLLCRYVFREGLQIYISATEYWIGPFQFVHTAHALESLAVGKNITHTKSMLLIFFSLCAVKVVIIQRKLRVIIFVWSRGIWYCTVHKTFRKGLRKDFEWYFITW